MKKLIAGVAATFAGLALTAETATAQFALPNDKSTNTNPVTNCECIDGQSRLSYQIDQVNQYGICLKPGDSFRISNERHGKTSYGRAIHMFNGDFGPMDGCNTPACETYSPFPDHPHGVLMAMLVNKGKVLSAVPVKDILNQTINIAKQGGELVFKVNDKNLNDNAGGGEMDVETHCAPANPPPARLGGARMN